LGYGLALGFGARVRA